MCMNILREAAVTARKEHPCIWCGEKIVKGEKYNLQAGKVDGEFQDNHYHGECFDAALVEFRNGNCDFEEGSYKRGTSEAR